MSASSPDIRTTVYYSGWVQGVGFRYTARQVAAGYQVTGYVRNLEDGRVELVIEGSRSEADQLLADIRQRMEGNIRDESVDRSDASGQFQSFAIRH